MLCRLCEAFTADVIHQEYSTWNRMNETEYGFKHGDHATISASTTAGCPICGLISIVRRKRIPGFDSLGEKWLIRNAMVIVDTSDLPFTFDLLSEGPNSSWLAFELFRPFRQGKTPSPTRVIDVGYSDETISPRLQVNRGQLGRYATLSHCWGSGKRLVTSKKTLKKFQTGIPYNQMPKTFQDAVKLTRMLGMRYLWIDALCIVQDDREDWRRESANMCSIYENAAFSISALSADDISSGFLHSRDIDQCIVTTGDLTFGMRPKLHTLDEALQDSRLESRAWCLQERILAPAILHVGSQQMFWECQSCQSCALSEAGPEAREGQASKPASTATVTHVPTTGDRYQLLHLWYGLVKEYSARDLTNTSDRLPAIPGLADKLRRELSSSPQYIDGLWLDDLPTGLLWQRPSRFKPSKTSSAKEAKILARLAPSWSWASVLGAVEYDWQADLKFHLSSSRDLTASFDGPGQSTLQVDGLIKRGMCRLSSSSSSTTIGNAAFKPSGSSIVIESIACILDDIEEGVPSHCYCLWISAWTSAQFQSTKKAKSIFYLVLERVHGSEEPRPPSRDGSSLGRFKRIGMGYDVGEKVTKVFSNAERHNLELT